MFFELYSQQIKVFLAAATQDVEQLRTYLYEILLSAGIDVVEGDKIEVNDCVEIMKTCNCSIHVLGNENILIGNKLSGIQYNYAKNMCNSDFKMFLWNPNGSTAVLNPYINNIRRDIIENTVYIDKLSPIVFVEELRNIMNVKQEVAVEHEETDIFFMYNELDNDTALDIYNMIKDFQSVVKLGLSMSNTVDYNSYISQQLSHSKIGVVYYNYAGDWAVSFARQVWKDNGGNSTGIPLFVVGNNEHATQDELSIFDGILECDIQERQRIPLDIKMFLDKVNQK